MPQHGDGWQEEESVREAEEARHKLHLNSQAYLSLTNCLRSLQNHSGWEPNILNPGSSVCIPVPWFATPS